MVGNKNKTRESLLIISNNIRSDLMINSDIIEVENLDIIKATSLTEGLSLLSENIKVNMIISNYTFADGKASSIFQYLNQNNIFIPTIIILEENENDLKTKALLDGASVVFLHPLKESELLLTTRNLINLTKSQATLKSSESIMEALGKSIEYKDELTTGHAKRVAKLSVKLYDALGLTDSDERYNLYLGCLLHDIGKIGIPDDILKSEKVFDKDGEEFKILMTHPQMGFEMSLGVQNETILQIILSHHEKLDGSGYPQGLHAKDIPTTIRISTIIDIFDSLNHKRRYRKKLSLEKTFEILEEEALNNKISYDIYRVFKDIAYNDNECKDIIDDITPQILE